MIAEALGARHEVWQIFVKDLIEWLSQEIGEVGQIQWNLLDLLNMATRSQSHGMLGHPGAINDSPAQVILQLLHHFSQMATGGKA